MRGTVQARRTKNRYPVRRADDIRPYDKTGARRGGRMISAPTKGGYPVWGTVHIHLHEKRKFDTVGGTCPPGGLCSAPP